MRRDDIRRLEGVADRAWPAAEVWPGPGWEARFADGMHRRINSASVWEAADLPDVVRRIEQWYARRGRPAIFKLTDASAPGLDEHLAGRGYARDALVQIMTASLDGTLPDPTHPVDLAAAASEEWMDAFAGMSGYGPERRRLLGEVLGRIRLPAAYAALREGGAIASVGLAVAEGREAGLFEMATAPGHRRRGMAGSVLAALLEWMARRGAAVAYLQVLEGNEPAERLYRGAGFETRYRYWYRVPPGWLSTMPR
ncbi:MAG: GNAT family N-acetyltransferase [Actinobacteria bacterium]|nr:GNAT family N-acetyltransferase [Actinomycetota bacterium]